MHAPRILLCAAVTAVIAASSSCALHGAPLLACSADADCAAGACVDGVCAAAVDGARPGDSGVDVDAPACASGPQVRIFPDDDRDGATGPSRLVCPDAIPSSASLVPHLGSVLLVEPDPIRPLSGLWDGDALTSPIGEAELSGFACASMPTAAAGLQVALALGSTVTGEHVTVTLVVESGGNRSAPRSVDVDVDADGLAIFGAPDDTFGLALTPADVCDETFALDISLTSTLGSEVFVAPAVIGVSGAEDCDDADPSVFSPADLRADDDGDGFGAGPALRTCIGLNVPPGKAVRDNDCAPADADAFPGQTATFARARHVVGGFDFDCNGVEEQAVPTIQDDVACTLSTDGTQCTVNYQLLGATCGESGTIGRCTNTCAHADLQFTETCR